MLRYFVVTLLLAITAAADISPSAQDFEIGTKLEERNVNREFDSIIDGIRKDKRFSDLKFIHIPDLEESKSFKVVFVWLHVSVKATEGTLSDLTSLRRDGNVILRTDKNTLTGIAEVSLDTLLVDFNYHIDAWELHPSGKMTFKVGENALKSVVSIRFDKSQCFLDFQSLEITRLDQVDVNVTGLGPFNGIASEVLTWLGNIFHNYLRKTIQSHVKDVLKTKFQHLEVCHFIHQKDS